MNNPIGYQSGIGKFYVWTEKWRVEYMKYFNSASEAAEFVQSNPGKCVRLTTLDTNALNAEWIQEAELLAKQSQEALQLAGQRESQHSVMSKKIVRLVTIFSLIFLAAALYIVDNNSFIDIAIRFGVFVFIGFIVIAIFSLAQNLFKKN